MRQIREKGGGAQRGGTLRIPSENQPRPQFGFLPWLAFFLARSFLLTVRFDIRVDTLVAPREASQSGGGPTLNSQPVNVEAPGRR